MIPNRNEYMQMQAVLHSPCPEHPQQPRRSESFAQQLDGPQHMPYEEESTDPADGTITPYHVWRYFDGMDWLAFPHSSWSALVLKWIQPQKVIFAYLVRSIFISSCSKKDPDHIGVAVLCCSMERFIALLHHHNHIKSYLQRVPTE